MNKASASPRREMRPGLELSVVGLGTAQFGLDYGFTRAFSQGLADEILDEARASGVNFLDTARVYGDAEEKIGRYLRRHRDHGLVVCTKLDALAPEDVKDSKKVLERLVRSAETSREALGLEKLPVLLLHQTDVLDNERVWDAVARLRERGLFETFGVSLYDVDEAERLLKARRPVGCVQVPYNVFDRRFAALAPRLRAAGCFVVGRSAFLKGMLVAEPEAVPSWLAGLRAPLERFRKIAGDHGFSPAELALLFALEGRAADATIVGVASVEELRRDVAAAGRLAQARAALAALAGLRLEDPALYDPRRWESGRFSPGEKV